jgi:hypothetical protein
MDVLVWHKIPKEHVPPWLMGMLISIGATVESDDEATIWRFFKNTHLEVDVEKLLFYAGVLKFREYVERAKK